MLKEIADGVFAHTSEFMQTNTLVVQGDSGVLLIDAGVRRDEMECLAQDLRQRKIDVVAGFSTHPHWDHLLWHPALGNAPRYGTERCAATVRERLPDAAAKARVTAMMPPDLVEHVPLELLGEIDGLTGDHVPWDGPSVRVVEHRAHASGHAAPVIDERGVLAAGDMLSDILIPMLDFGSDDPIGDYLVSLDLLEAIGMYVIVPGHGSAANADQLRKRLELDRNYLHALRDRREADDPRLAQDAIYGDAMRGVHERQVSLRDQSY